MPKISLHTFTNMSKNVIYHLLKKKKKMENKCAQYLQYDYNLCHTQKNKIKLSAVQFHFYISD